MILLNLVVETNKTSSSDVMYIDTLLKHYYVIDNQIKIKYHYLSTKTQYDNNKITKEIKEYEKKLKPNIIYTIYFIDTDNYDLDHNDEILNFKIKKYCEDNEYQLVWFCKNIENVFLHKNVVKDQKTSEAKKFANKNNISVLKEEDLMRKEYARNTSNILLVLDKILKRNK